MLASSVLVVLEIHRFQVESRIVSASQGRLLQHYREQGAFTAWEPVYLPLMWTDAFPAACHFLLAPLFSELQATHIITRIPCQHARPCSYLFCIGLKLKPQIISLPTSDSHWIIEDTHAGFYPENLSECRDQNPSVCATGPRLLELLENESGSLLSVSPAS